MVDFQYIIKEPSGLHARPAGYLVQKAKEYNSTITVTCNNKTVDATRLMALMQLGIKCGQEITVTIEGEDEQIAKREMKRFFDQNL